MAEVRFGSATDDAGLAARGANRHLQSKPYAPKGGRAFLRDSRSIAITPKKG